MTHSESEQQKQRRRSVLKAVAGAPVIFTLSAGADVAAASITCKDKSAALATTNPPPGALPSAAGTDIWVRYRVENVTIQTTGNGGALSNVFNLGGVWYRVDGNTVSRVTSNINTGQGATSFNPQRYYYLLVDHTKYLNSAITSPQSFVYLGADNSVTAPIAGSSCWNSIPPGANLTTNLLN